MKTDKKAVFYVILAGSLWGLISIFINNLNACGYDSLAISKVRMLFAAPMFAAVMAIKDPKILKIHLKDLWMFIGTGIVSVALFNLSYFYTIIHSQASVAVVLLYTSPIFIMLISALLFKEKITVKKIIALIMTFTGCVFVAGLIGSGGKISGIVLLTGIASGLFYALYTIFGRFALKKYRGETVTAYTFILGLIGLLPVGGFGNLFSGFVKYPSSIFWSFGISLVCTVLPYFFYTAGLAKMESGKAAILVAVEPLVGALIGICVYHESHGILKIAGIALILASIVVMNLPDKRKQSI